MRSIHTRVLGLLAAMALIVPGVALAPTRALADETYQIYPTPHSVVYAGGTQTLRSTVTTVVEDGDPSPLGRGSRAQGHDCCWFRVRAHVTRNDLDSCGREGVRRCR